VSLELRAAILKAAGILEPGIVLPDPPRWTRRPRRFRPRSRRLRRCRPPSPPRHRHPLRLRRPRWTRWPGSRRSAAGSSCPGTCRARSRWSGAGTYNGSIVVGKAGITLLSYGEGLRPLILSDANGNPKNGSAIEAINVEGPISIQGIDLVPVSYGKALRGHGLFIQGKPLGIALRDMTITGFMQNMVIQGAAATNDITIERVISGGAWANSDDAFYQGQGLYFAATGNGKVRILDSVFHNNGLPLHRPEAWNTAERNQYCHGIYHQLGAARLDVQRCAFIKNVAAGLQTRSGVDLTDCSFYDNGQAIIHIEGQTTATNTVIVYGHRVWMGNDWDAMNGVLAYDPILLDGLVLVGRPAMANADPILPTKRSKSYMNGGGFNGDSGWEHEGKKHGKGAVWNVKGVQVYGWPAPIVFGKFAPDTMKFDFIGRVTNALANIPAPAIEVGAAAKLRTAVQAGLGGSGVGRPALAF
jgi:hypothetical protein